MGKNYREVGFNWLGLTHKNGAVFIWDEFYNTEKEVSNAKKINANLKSEIDFFDHKNMEIKMNKTLLNRIFEKGEVSFFRDIIYLTYLEKSISVDIEMDFELKSKSLLIRKISYIKGTIDRNEH